MRRRFSLLALAALLSLSAIAPASAAEPVDGPIVEADSTAEPTSAPTPETSPDPDPTQPPAEPSPAATVEPSAEPTVEPTAPPSAEPTVEPSAEPQPDLTAEPAEPTDAAAERPAETGEYIVVLRPGADVAARAESHRTKQGVRVGRKFERAVRGYAAKLNAGQRKALEADPDVVAIVADEWFQVQAQSIPTGVSRAGTLKSTVAKINGVDERIDADVAIVDTGIQPNHPDLNVVGGYNCSTSNRSLWRDVHGHGTHVAGTVGALDNTSGVVGVAPGARLWSVKILDDTGWGKLSWYVCGLDWILAQRDPVDSSRPLFEAVNMSVAKARTVVNDNNCGKSKIDVLHQAVCRVVAGGIPVAVAAGNSSANVNGYIPAMYAEAITVSALADTDGKPGALGGNLCYSWGSYDKDDTFANFSNYGKNVDIMGPGKCIWSTKVGSTYGYMSGTSMATPAVAGAIALYKESRPRATPAEVREALQYLGNLGWKVSTDPDNYHEKLLDVSKIGALGTFTLGVTNPGSIGEKGGLTQVTVNIGRSSTFFERVKLSLSSVPAGWAAALNTTSVMGWTGKTAVVSVTVPAGTKDGTYELRVTGTNQGRTQSTVVPVVVGSDNPVASPPTARLKSGKRFDSAVRLVVSWSAATDASSAIDRYQWQLRRNGGAWSASTKTSADKRSFQLYADPGAKYDVRVRARDTAGNWSPWVMNTQPFKARVVNDRHSSLTYQGSWSNVSNGSATKGTLKDSRKTGATVRRSVTARSIAVIAPTSAKRGWLEIRVNGTLLKTVSLKTSSVAHRRIVWAGSWSNSATRTIELRVVRDGNRPRVSLDGLLFLK